jgi:hypothetical protein
MTDERVRAAQTQRCVIEVLHHGPATPAQVIKMVLEIDDRMYSSDRVRGAINTLLNRHEVTIEGGQVRLSRP